MPYPQAVLDVAAQVRNWGRWGADDQIGTLNFITDDAVRAAAALVRHGKRFSLAYPLQLNGLQTGAIDGQDNPLPNVQNMKFYEVMSQIVLTSHLVGYDLLTVNLKTWNAMSPDRQKTFQAAADRAIAWSTAEHLKREAELAEGFRKQGLNVYAPDVNAFRAYAQKVYLASDEAKEWPKGMLEKIGALK